MRARLVLLVVLVVSFNALRVSVAHAGPVEQLQQLLFQPGHPDTRILRYANGGDGLFYSHDGGAGFGLACVSSISSTLQRSGTLALAGDGKTLMGIFSGVWQDDGQGCAWSTVDMFQDQWVTDFAADPTDDAVMYAVTGTSMKLNGVFRRAADGTWTELGSRDLLLINTLDVAAMADGKRRFYEGVLKTSPAVEDGGTPTSQYLVRVSDDEGDNWQEFPFVSSAGGQFRIAAIDPTNPDRIVAVVDHEGQDDSILVSDNKGETFSEYLMPAQYGGIAITPDGQVFIGDSGGMSGASSGSGLFAAASLSDAPKKIADYVVQCLAYEKTSKTLYACQHWLLGTVDPASGAFTTSFKFAEAMDFLSCDNVDMSATCKTQLCGAYCGPGHFAQAPLCAAYDEPECGPTAADDVSGSGGMSDSAGAGAVGGGGGAGAGGAGGAGSATKGDSGSQAGTSASGSAGAATETPPKQDSGGCTIANFQGDRGATSTIVALGLVLSSLLRRRRRGA